MAARLNESTFLFASVEFEHNHGFHTSSKKGDMKVTTCPRYWHCVQLTQSINMHRLSCKNSSWRELVETSISERKLISGQQKLNFMILCSSLNSKLIGLFQVCFPKLLWVGWKTVQRKHVQIWRSFHVVFQRIRRDQLTGYEKLPKPEGFWLTRPCQIHEHH